MTIQKKTILAHSHSHPVVERLIRHRWALGFVAIVSLLSMVAASAIAPLPDQTDIARQVISEPLTVPLSSIIETPDALFLHEERVQRSDTLASLMSRLGINDRAAFDFIRQDKNAQSLGRQLRPGKTITAKTNEAGELHSLYFPLNTQDVMLVVERKDSGFVASEQSMRLEKRTVVKSGSIQSSLFAATDAAEIPDAIATQLAEIFSSEIDFHRDLRKGDYFSIVYETLSHQGKTLRSGQILSAEFSNNQKTYRAYWFPSGAGKGAYYTAEGKSLRTAFLRSPLEFSRVTSGFSSARFHPVLQAWRAHKGVDYGAPKGTRVRAVADGVVEFAGQQGGYGNLVVLKHQGVYSTAYGHLNGFASGIRKGARVSQGETIAYVGQTGLATGPHLHYEFRVQNQQVNPLAVNLPTAIPLEALQLKQYKGVIAPLQAQLAMARKIHLAAQSD